MDLKRCDYCYKIETYAVTGSWGRITFHDPHKIIDKEHNELSFDVCPECMKNLFDHVSNGKE